jgi:hypothetical protein
LYKRSILGSVVILSLFLIAGCGAQKGTTEIKYEKSTQRTTIAAPQDGTYALYTASDLTPKVRQNSRSTRE